MGSSASHDETSIVFDGRLLQRVHGFTRVLRDEPAVSHLCWVLLAILETGSLLGDIEPDLCQSILILTASCIVYCELKKHLHALSLMRSHVLEQMIKL